MSTAVYLRDDVTGTMYTVLKNYIRLEYARAENQTGLMLLDLAPDAINPAWLRRNMRLEPWRTAPGIAPYLDGDSAFFLQRWWYDVDDNGAEVLHLEAYDGNFFIEKHIVAYASDDALASFTTTEIDDAIKAIVRSNMGATATDTARDLSTWLSVQADLTAAPTTTKEFSRKKLDTLLQDLADESFQQGTYLAFDTVYTGPATMEFRTYIGQRGVDHGQTSAQPVVISRERKNLEQPTYTVDYVDSANYIYAGGQGTGEARIVKTTSSTDAIGLNRRELWVDARNVELEDSIQSAANAALYTYRPRRTVSGKIKDTAGCRYGVHYKFGDIVYVEYREGFDCHVNAIHAIIEKGKETMDIRVKGEL